jgi:hypothetical protein
MQRLLRLINNTAAPNGPLLLIANIKQLDFSALPTRSVVMTDEGILKSLIKCDPVCLSLRHLDLSNCTRITDDCMANFLEKCENLQWLRLDGCDQLTDRCFIGRQWHRLLHISLRGCRQLTNQTLLALSRTENGQPGCLRSFSITFARQINGEGLIELCKIHGECLRLLEVCGSGKLTNCHLECISRYATGIQDLCLRFNYGRLSADGVCTALEKWSQLRRMQITLPLVSTTEHGWVRMRLFNNDQLSELRAQYPKVTFVDDSD